jgi:DNA replication protein DnaC
VLFISDPGARGREAMTDFMATSLFSVIDARYRARKPTWITLNTETPQEAEFRLGTPIVDRLRDRSLRVFCDWPSWRQRECGLFDE